MRDPHQTPCSGRTLVLENTGKIADFYDMDRKKVGQGSYGYVVKCTNKGTKLVRACKVIAKSAMKNLARFKDEVRIMKMLDHPNIIKLYETFEDSRTVYLVMELCTGGELFDRILEMGAFTEVQAAIVMQHILRGMYYMHELHTCHRDLKPENFLLTTKEPIEQTTIKIIDFGLAREFSDNLVMTTKAGTPYYVAPQVLQGKYDHMADLWSCGVIMYVLLCGYPPFHGDTDQAVLAKVRLGAFEFSGREWDRVSGDAKDLVGHLLKMNPKERCTAQRALEHVWVASTAPRAKNVPMDQSIMGNLRAFRGQNKLKKAALQVIANQMNETQIKQLREVFVGLDANGDGLLTAAELQEGMKKAGFEEIPADLQQIMNDVDADKSGVIDYTEFLAATLDKKMYMQEDIVWQAFRVFDKNGDGRISREEIAAVLGDDGVAAQANRDMAELLKEVDANGDGEIDFDEFMQMMRGA